MQVTTFEPSAQLAPFVARYTVVESAYETTRALLPDLGLILGVRFAGAATLVEGVGETRMPDASFAGFQARVRHMRTHANSGVVLVAFRPGGAAAFFRAPLHELYGTATELAALLGRAEVARLAERIAGARDHAGRIAILEEMLLARLGDGDPVVDRAVEAILGARGAVRVASLAARLAIAQDPLEKRFRRAVGASPKQLASLVRVRHAIALGQRGASWSQAAHAAGYFDQSHFNREFRAVTGAAPRTFFRDDAYC